MAILADTRTGPITQADGAGDEPLRQGRLGALIIAQGHGRYFEAASRRNLFSATAFVAAAGMIAFGTAGAQSGPVIWNGSNDINVHIIAVSWASTVAFTTAGLAIGLTGNTGQTSAPTSTTAIDAKGNNYMGGAASKATAYRVATLVNGGAFFLPIGGLHTGTVALDTALPLWVELASSLVVPPNAWAGVAASAAT